MLQDYPSLFDDFEIGKYPSGASHKDKLGFILERMGYFVLNPISEFRGEKLDSQCEDPKKYKETNGKHSDSQMGEVSIEFKNWETSSWKRMVTSDDVEEINSRFRDDDPNHEKTWIAVVADIQGFSQNMLDKVEADHIIDIGYQVFDPEEATENSGEWNKKAAWILFKKLCRVLDVSILRVLMEWTREKGKKIASKTKEMGRGLCYNFLNLPLKKTSCNSFSYNNTNDRGNDKDPPLLSNIKDFIRNCLRGKNSILEKASNTLSQIKASLGKRNNQHQIVRSEVINMAEISQERAEYVRGKKRRRKKWLHEILPMKCPQCGEEIDIDELCFHHPGKKNYKILGFCLLYSKENILQEVALTVPMHLHCHWEREGLIRADETDKLDKYPLEPLGPKVTCDF